jgi:methionyl-tRNA formyltransferase
MTKHSYPRTTFIWCTYRDWSFRVLEGLLDIPSWNCSLIVTTHNCQYDLSPFERRGIEILRIDPRNDLKSDGIGFQAIKAGKPAVIFHYGWSWLVPECVLDLCLNVTLHPGKLPKDRGGSPIQIHIRNGETWTFANIIQLVPALDEGPYFLRERISLEGDAVDSVWARMITAGTLLSRQFLADFLADKAAPNSQDSTIEPTMYKRVRPEDAEIHPNTQDSHQVYNIIRAHNETDPNTYVHSAYLDYGANRLIIDRAMLLPPPHVDTVATYNLTERSFSTDQLVDIAHQVNNNLAIAFVTASDKTPVFLTQIRVACQ